MKAERFLTLPLPLLRQIVAVAYNGRKSAAAGLAVM